MSATEIFKMVVPPAARFKVLVIGSLLVLWFGVLAAYGMVPGVDGFANKGELKQIADAISSHTRENAEEEIRALRRQYCASNDGARLVYDQDLQQAQDDYRKNYREYYHVRPCPDVK